MGGAARQIYAPSVQLNKEEHLHSLKEKCIHGEEIAGQDLFLVVRHQPPSAD
jgi:hypothetical protein